MAFYKKGYLGQFSGLLGTAVGSSWKGKPVLRSRPVRVKRSLSDRQEAASAKFSLVRNFCNILSEVFQLTMSTADNTGLNVASKMVSDEAVTGVYPSLAIDFSKVKISVGKKTAKATNASITSTIARKVDFAWDYDSSITRANANDRALLVIFCPENGEAEYILQGPERQTEAATMTLSELSGKVVHAWIAFRSFEGENSDSSYIGTVTVA
jgi:hypothetical protein